MHMLLKNCNQVSKCLYCGCWFLHSVLLSNFNSCGLFSVSQVILCFSHTIVHFPVFIGSFESTPPHTPKKETANKMGDKKGRAHWRVLRTTGYLTQLFKYPQRWRLEALYEDGALIQTIRVDRPHVVWWPTFWLVGPENNEPHFFQLPFGTCATLHFVEHILWNLCNHRHFSILLKCDVCYPVTLMVGGQLRWAWWWDLWDHSIAGWWYGGGQMPRRTRGTGHWSGSQYVLRRGDPVLEQWSECK